MAEPAPRLNGENARVVIKFGAVAFDQGDILKSCTVSPVIVDHKDDFLGSHRAKLDQQLRGFTWKIESFHATAVLYNAWLAREAKREANLLTAADDITIILILENRTAIPTPADGWALAPCEFKMDLQIGGATERIMDSLEGSAEDFKPVAF
jgi:hypothetical protein